MSAPSASSSSSSSLASASASSSSSSSGSSLSSVLGAGGPPAAWAALVQTKLGVNAPATRQFMQVLSDVHSASIVLVEGKSRLMALFAEEPDLLKPTNACLPAFLPQKQKGPSERAQLTKRPTDAPKPTAGAEPTAPAASATVAVFRRSGATAAAAAGSSSTHAPTTKDLCYPSPTRPTSEWDTCYRWVSEACLALPDFSPAYFELCRVGDELARAKVTPQQAKAAIVKILKGHSTLIKQLDEVFPTLQTLCQYQQPSFQARGSIIVSLNDTAWSTAPSATPVSREEQRVNTYMNMVCQRYIIGSPEMTALFDILERLGAFEISEQSALKEISQLLKGAPALIKPLSEAGMMAALRQAGAKLTNTRLHDVLDRHAESYLKSKSASSVATSGATAFQRAIYEVLHPHCPPDSAQFQELVRLTNEAKAGRLTTAAMVAALKKLFAPAWPKKLDELLVQIDPPTVASSSVAPRTSAEQCEYILAMNYLSLLAGLAQDPPRVRQFWAILRQFDEEKLTESEARQQMKRLVQDQPQLAEPLDTAGMMTALQRTHRMQQKITSQAAGSASAPKVAAAADSSPPMTAEDVCYRWVSRVCMALPDSSYGLFCRLGDQLGGGQVTPTHAQGAMAKLLKGHPELLKQLDDNFPCLHRLCVRMLPFTKGKGTVIESLNAAAWASVPSSTPRSKEDQMGDDYLQAISEHFFPGAPEPPAFFEVLMRWSLGELSESATQKSLRGVLKGTPALLKPLDQPGMMAALKRAGAKLTNMRRHHVLEQNAAVWLKAKPKSSLTLSSGATAFQRAIYQVLHPHCPPDSAPFQELVRLTRDAQSGFATTAATVAALKKTFAHVPGCSKSIDDLFRQLEGAPPPVASATGQGAQKKSKMGAIFLNALLGHFPAHSPADGHWREILRRFASGAITEQEAKQQLKRLFTGHPAMLAALDAPGMMDELKQSSRDEPAERSEPKEKKEGGSKAGVASVATASPAASGVDGGSPDSLQTRPPINLSLCAFCLSPAKSRCGRCRMVVYCCPEHQAAHWKAEHKKDCAVCAANGEIQKMLRLFEPTEPRANTTKPDAAEPPISRANQPEKDAPAAASEWPTDATGWSAELLKRIPLDSPVAAKLSDAMSYVNQNMLSAQEYAQILAVHLPMTLPFNADLLRFCVHHGLSPSGGVDCTRFEAAWDDFDREPNSIMAGALPGMGGPSNREHAGWWIQLLAHLPRESLGFAELARATDDLRQRKATWDQYQSVLTRLLGPENPMFTLGYATFCWRHRPVAAPLAESNSTPSTGTVRAPSTTDTTNLNVSPLTVHFQPSDPAPATGQSAQTDGLPKWTEQQLHAFLGQQMDLLCPRGSPEFAELHRSLGGLITGALTDAESNAIFAQLFGSQPAMLDLMRGVIDHKEDAFGDVMRFARQTQPKEKEATRTTTDQRAGQDETKTPLTPESVEYWSAELLKQIPPESSLAGRISDAMVQLHQSVMTADVYALELVGLLAITPALLAGLARFCVQHGVLSSGLAEASRVEAATAELRRDPKLVYQLALPGMLHQDTAVRTSWLTQLLAHLPRDSAGFAELIRATGDFRQGKATWPQYESVLTRLLGQDPMFTLGYATFCWQCRLSPNETSKSASSAPVAPAATPSAAAASPPANASATPAAGVAASKARGDAMPPEKPKGVQPAKSPVQSPTSVSQASVALSLRPILSLVLRFLQPRQELPVAARLSRAWYAAACHPKTWPDPDFDVDFAMGARLHTSHEMTFTTADALRQAVDSCIYVNLAAVRLAASDSHCETAAAMLPLVRRFRRLRSLRYELPIDDEHWIATVRADACASLQLLSVDVSAFALMVQAGARMATPCASTLQYLQVAYPGVTISPEHQTKLKRFLSRCADLGTHRTRFEFVAPPGAILSPEQLAQRHALECAIAKAVSLLPASGAPSTAIPACGSFNFSSAPIIRYRRYVTLDKWDGALDRTRFDRIMKTFPDIESLNIRLSDKIHRDASALDLAALQRDPEKMWGHMDDFECRLSALRFLSSESSVGLSNLSSRWVRHSGRLFGDLETLEVHAKGMVDTDWTADFQRMPFLTDLTMHGLALTTCAPFAHLPELRRLHGVLWPIDSKAIDSKEAGPALPAAPNGETEVDPMVRRARYFPALVGWHVRSCWLDLPADQRLSEANVPSFPRHDLLQFIGALPKRLRLLSVETCDSPVQQLTLATIAQYVRQQEQCALSPLVALAADQLQVTSPNLTAEDAAGDAVATATPGSAAAPAPATASPAPQFTKKDNKKKRGKK